MPDSRFKDIADSADPGFDLDKERELADKSPMKGIDKSTDELRELFKNGINNGPGSWDSFHGRIIED